MNGFGAAEQPSSTPGRQALRLDEDPASSKTPLGDLNKSQRVANAGETVPILFAKRAPNGLGADVGGVWMQPPLVKTASNEFVGSFVYAISQGEIVSNPVKWFTWVGLRNLQHIEDQTITLTHYYSTSATLAATPNACPLTGGQVFCGINTFSYLSELFKAEVGAKSIQRLVDNSQYYNNSLLITRGVGDTTNSVMFVATSNFEVYDNGTGADLTAAYFAAIGITPSPTTYFVYNAIISGGSIIGAHPVGYIQNLPIYPLNLPNFFYLSIGATGSVTITQEVSIVNNQANPSNPPSTGTLYGMQYEYHLSEFADPNSPPGTEDYTAFADITFLQVDGNIYDPPDAGSYPTTTQQLYILYEEGVEVDLYSGGLVSGSYAKGASNQFVDLIMYMFTIYKRIEGAATAEIAAPVDTTNLVDIAAYCSNYNLYFNGIVPQSMNIVEYASSIAPYFDLAFISNGGQYQFANILPVDGSNQIEQGALTAVATFTEDEILPGSFNKSYKSADDRRDVIAVVVWREVAPDKIGIQRTVSVRYTDVSIDAPIIQFDMSDFCTDVGHAQGYATAELARRRHSTHSISFSTPLLTTSLKPTDLIKVERQRISSRGDNRQEIEWYQISSIKHNSDGVSVVDADHFPVDNNDSSLIVADLFNNVWTIS